jgi:hypothetical protein
MTLSREKIKMKETIMQNKSEIPKTGAKTLNRIKYKAHERGEFGKIANETSHASQVETFNKKGEQIKNVGGRVVKVCRNYIRDIPSKSVSIDMAAIYIC